MSPGPHESLEALAQRLLAAADPSALAAEIQQQLHDRLAPGLIRHFQRKGLNLTDSEDLAHQTWILFWESLTHKRYDPSRARLSTYLYALAHTIHLRSLRSRQTAQLHDTQPDSTPTPAAAAALAAEIENVRQVLISPDVSPDDRATLRAIAEGRTDRELARILNISPSTAHQRKKTALDRLARLLQSAASPRAPHPPAANNQ